MGRRSKYIQGKWKPSNPEKYVGDVNNIVFRSSWELKFLKWCDNNPSVIRYCSEELVIPYWSQADEKMRRYFTDFVVKFRHQSGNTKTFIVEIKPEVQTIKPVRGKKRAKTFVTELYNYQVNQDKWAAAAAYAEKNGMGFKVLNEYDIGIKVRKKDKHGNT